MCLTAMIGASLAGSALQASSANKAVNAQTAAANADLGVRERIYDETVDRFEPFYESGLQGQNALAFELGLGDKPEGYAGFKAQPGYQFGLDEGINALNASAAGRGNLFSGATGKRAVQFGQDYANRNYSEYLNNLKGFASSGQNAAGGQAAAGQNYAQGASSAYGAIGNAQAAGAIGVGNALNQGISNGVGIWQYQNMLDRM